MGIAKIWATLSEFHAKLREQPLGQSASGLWPLAWSCRYLARVTFIITLIALSLIQIFTPNPFTISFIIIIIIVSQIDRTLRVLIGNYTLHLLNRWCK